MKWLSDYRMKTVLAGVVAAIVFGGGRAKADFTFGEPTNLGPKVNTRFMDRGGSLSADGLMLFFDCDKPDFGKFHIYMVIRDAVDDDWSDPVDLGPIINDQMYSETEPAISSDGLELYYSWGAPRALGIDKDLYVSTRNHSTDRWANPVSLGTLVNGPGNERGPTISGDGLSLYFESDRPDGFGGRDLWVTTRATRDDDWAAPVNLGAMLNGSGDDFAPSVTADNLTLIFSSDRPGSTGEYADVWVTTRRSASDPWREPINLGPIINTDDEDFARISPDGTMLFVTYWKRAGGRGLDDIWQVPVLPIVDFNGDGNVDGADINIMVDHWGQDSSLCDIGPTVWGDGVVNVHDLAALAEYIGKDVDDPTLVAHWALDENAGMIAADGVGENDAVVIGDPTWKPDGGQVGGALQLDGVDDCVIAPSVLNPAERPFTVLAWVKGGAPGQVVISQQGGSDWLMLDPVTGVLMTELKSGGRSSAVLYSDAIITDGAWHRVGFTWDGSTRRLYVDDMLVGQDAQGELAGCSGGLKIGSGHNVAPGTYWTGLIDDVRIYSRAVRP